MGVMPSFSVAKKVTDEDVNKYFSKQKRSGKKESQIGAMLRDKILAEIQTAIETNQIPGLITPQEIAANMGIDKNVIARLPEINRLVSIVSQKLTEKKYDKMSMCCFINSLVNILGLTEDDFMKFHRQNEEGDDDGDEDE